MARLQHIRVRCDGCRALGTLESIDGVAFHPPGWVEIGREQFCTNCAPVAKESFSGLPEAVLERAQRAVFAMQSLVATELHAQVSADQKALVAGGDNAARRMKRVELLVRRAGELCSLYGLEFQQGFPGAFTHTSLADCVGALEALLQAEIVFPSRVKMGLRVRAKLYGEPPNMYDEYSYGGAKSERLGENSYFYRMQNVSLLAQKLASLAALRAGEVVGGTPEDEMMDEAFDDGLMRRRRANEATPIDTVMRQLTHMFEVITTQQAKQQEDREARFAAAPLPIGIAFQDPVRDLQKLLDLRTQLVEAGRDAAVAAVDKKIAELEERLSAPPEIQGELAAEAVAKDVTPKTPEQKFAGAAGAIDAPPSGDELERLRRDVGDEAVKAAFPEAYARLMATPNPPTHAL